MLKKKKIKTTVQSSMLVSLKTTLFLVPQLGKYWEKKASFIYFHIKLFVVETLI